MQRLIWLVLGLTLGLFLLHAGSFPIAYGDLFWQIKVGELFWTTKSFPRIDPFAFTSVGKDWIEHEWLIELFYYALHSLGGLLAIRIFFGLLWTVGTVFLFLGLTRSWKDRPLAYLAILAWLILIPRQFAPAPSTISIWMAIGFAFLVAPWKELSLFRWGVAILYYWVWCNMHAVALLALPFVFVFVLAPGISKLERKRRILLFIGTTAVSFLNPYGYHIHIYGLVGRDISETVDEWKPLLTGTYVNNLVKCAFLALSFTCIGLFIHRVREQGRNFLSSFEAPYVVVSLLSIAFAFHHSRLTWLGIIPITYLASHIPLQRLKWEKLGSGMFLLFFLCWSYGWNPAMARTLFQREYYENNLRGITLPIGAADYLLTHPLPQPIFNHYIWGGYLIYRLHPHYKVFVDGRAVLHGKKLLQDELHITNGGPDTPELLKRYGFRTLVVGPHFFSPETAANLGWKLVYQDAASAVYVRSLP